MKRPLFVGKNPCSEAASKGAGSSPQDPLIPFFIPLIPLIPIPWPGSHDHRPGMRTEACIRSLFLRYRIPVLYRGKVSKIAKNPGLFTSFCVLRSPCNAPGLPSASRRIHIFSQFSADAAYQMWHNTIKNAHYIQGNIHASFGRRLHSTNGLCSPPVELGKSVLCLKTFCRTVCRVTRGIDELGAGEGFPKMPVEIVI